MKRLVFALFLLILPFSAHAAADLRIGQGDIDFSEDTLIAGDAIRIYATIYNDGDEDVSGYVTFFQGSVPIGDSQVISLLSDGSPEEVYVDFVVPSSSFNIRAEIRGTDPEDSNTSNNTTITSVYDPVFDDDRDGVANENDNCPTTSNESQLDTDGDGEGDACDDDDDDDGLTDEVEDELGTDSTQADTDGDGTDDPDDAYPTDSSKTEIEVEIEEEVQVIVEDDSSQTDVERMFSELVEEVVAELREEQEGAGSEGRGASEVDEVSISPNALFKYERVSWNTYSFEVVGPEVSTISYEWDFGDGVTSSKTIVEHVYDQSGAYNVQLSMTGTDGEISTESITLFVPFFSLENNIILLAIAGLTLLLIAGSGLFISMIMRERRVSRITEALKKAGKKKASKKKLTKIVVKDEGDD